MGMLFSLYYILTSSFVSLHSAAYQVGLSFLNTHMRRAVAACTSPEVFFSASYSGEQGHGGQDMTTDPLGLAMDSLEIVTND